ncbi:serine protease 56 [Polyodon spathula]|uniref:serine protease 56 n=1 Tax=Polyodon spathula TaxID=7913 RepID=UPI001B7E749A|nr:serine protease 56 [Polyodon spathula]
MTMLLVFLLLMLVCCSAAPTGREVTRLPQSALQDPACDPLMYIYAKQRTGKGFPGSLIKPRARLTVVSGSLLSSLSERGTVVLEAALAGALSAVDVAMSESSRVELECEGCSPCLYQDCGKRSGPCAAPAVPPAEPSCEEIGRAQGQSDERERNWALSQTCRFYRQRCPAEEKSCLRVMRASCRARVLQCSLMNTIENLDPVFSTKTQGVCGRQAVVSNVTQPRFRIVGGSPAALGGWPWLVSLRLDGGMMCAGVLVGSSWVLTAAHCFTGSRNENLWRVVVGEYDLTQTDPEEQVLQVNRILTHPKFNQKSFNNDIALVELTSAVPVSRHVTPVCLPSAGGEPAIGTACYVAGWGSLYEADGPSADVVMEAKMPVLSQGTCKSALGKELLTSTMFCAGYLSGGIDSCQGDSGGPLTCQDPQTGLFQLYGITSWGDGCGERGKPGVYTRFTAFSDWVSAEIQKSSGSREPTCPELLKAEQKGLEFSRLCQFYESSCSSSLGDTACTRLAEEKCHSQQKKCQLRSFLQILLDLLRQAEDFIRDKVDLTFFTQTLPQFMEQIYTSTFTRRERRDAPSQTEQVQETALPQHTTPHPPALFDGVGPRMEDWVEYLRGMAEDLDKDPSSGDAKTLGLEEQLFLQEDASVLQSLQGDYRSLINTLRVQLGSSNTMDRFNLEESTAFTVSHRLPAASSAPSPATQSAGPSSDLRGENWRKRWARRRREALGAKGKGCPGLREAALRVSLLREMHCWILEIPPHSLSMSFQEVLVDMASKNQKGLYEARVHATVGGHPVTFYSLVGLESNTFYRSMPRVLALALDATKMQGRSSRAAEQQCELEKLQGRSSRAAEQQNELEKLQGRSSRAAEQQNELEKLQGRSSREAERAGETTRQEQ